MNTQPRYRVLVALRGASLSHFGYVQLDDSHLTRLATEIALAHRELGVELAVMIDGTNIVTEDFRRRWRGSGRVRSALLVASIVNALAIASALDDQGQSSRVMTSLQMDRIAEPYIRERALVKFAEGHVVVLSTSPDAPRVGDELIVVARAMELDAMALLESPGGATTGRAQPEPSSSVDRTVLSFAEEHGVEVDTFDATIPGALFDALRKRAAVGKHSGKA